MRYLVNYFDVIYADFRRFYSLDLRQELQRGCLLNLYFMLNNLPPDAMFWFRAKDEFDGVSTKSKKPEELELVRGPRMVPAGSIEKFAQGFMPENI